MAHQILRLPMVKARSGKGRSSLYRDIAAGLWPKPVSLGARAVGWPDDEVEAINVARIAGKSEAEIRELVMQLETNRRAKFISQE